MNGKDNYYVFLCHRDNLSNEKNGKKLSNLYYEKTMLNQC